MSRKTAPCLLIAGAGDVGMRLARLRVARGDDVIAVRRRERPATAGVRDIQADLVLGAGLERVPKRPDAVVFCAAPGQRDEAIYRALFIDGLCRLLDRVDAPRWLFVSSTAVYGQDAGEWIDETALTVPDAFNGRVLLDAERELSGHRSAIVLRLSGIYGPARETMLWRARALEPGRAHWTNRIHADDAAAALSHWLDLPKPEPLYLGSDDSPALESELLAWIRAQENLPNIVAAAGPESGRRVSNRRLRDSGWLPTHPDFRSGYLRLLADAGV
jgi:electron-transferring-flavoprotein dehydrogenase